MIALAIDTSASLCAACLWEEGTGEIARTVRDVGKGHAEILMEVVAETLAVGRVAYGDLDAVAVSVGPGSFTGIRVGVAAARGLALALRIPAIGVGSMEALALEARDAERGRDVLVVLDAGRGQVYLGRFDAEGGVQLAPAATAVEDAVAQMADDRALLVGSGISTLPDAAVSSMQVVHVRQSADIAAYARLAVAKAASTADIISLKPRPLYLRSADAKPQSDFALPRKS